MSTITVDDSQEEYLNKRIAVLNKLLNMRALLLDAIPPCPVHGLNCVPRALEWIERVKTALAMNKIEVT